MLKYIKTTKCPTCGCTDIIRERVETNMDKTEILEHCLGGRWEHREFLCGCHITYEPNFQKEEIANFPYCKKDPVVIAALEKERKEKEELIALLQKQNNDLANALILKIEQNGL